MNNGNDNQHLNFVYEDIQSSDTFYEQGPSIHLINPFYKINFFEIIPKNFKITTNNGSFYFNIDMLIDTSSIISEFVENNPGIFVYHLDITDEGNVLGKIEQIYQGKVVIFNENDLSVFKQIKSLLNLIKIPNIEKQQYLKENIYFSSVVISKESFHSFISNETFQTFQIITKNHEYNCNSIGIQFSKVIQTFILQNPTKNKYIYDFDDDFSEFQYISDFFNLKKVDIQPENMAILKKISEDLEITIIINDINKYIDEYEQLIKVVDEQQSLADSISELFNYLYQIENLTISKVKYFILESEWSSSIEKVQEFAAFILQIVKSDFLLQNSMIDLLIELNDEGNQMKILIPFIVSKLMNLFGESKQNCSFIYKLHQKGFIPKEAIETKLYEVYFHKREKKCFDNVFDWFFPEIVQLSIDDDLQKIINKFDDLRKSFFNSYLPDKLDKYKEMLNSGEPDNIIAKLIRCDDVSSLRSIIIKDKIDILKNVVPYNIYEDFIQNGSTNYLNYAAAYGSVRCFKFMLLNHVDINPLSFEYAVYGGNYEIIHIVDQNSSNDFPPKVLKHFKMKIENKFIQAIRKHQNDLFKWLIEEKFDRNGKNHDLLNMLAITAIQNGNAFSLIELIAKGYQLLDILKLIQISVENGFVLLTKILLNIAKARNLSFSPIIKSILSFENLSIFVLFADVMNQNDLNDSLKYSIENDCKNITEYIFDNLLDTKFGNQISFIEEILNISVRKKENELFFYILNKLQNLSSNIEKNINWEEKLLPNACKYSHFIIVQKIIEVIIKHKSNDKHDLTESFKQAAISGSIDICKYLANCSLDINYEQLSKSGNELHSIKGSIFSFMIDQSPDLKDSFCDNFIYHSIKNNNEELVEFILKQKSDLLNNISSEGTPLIIASEKNYTSIVKCLLSFDNIDPSLTNSNNETALQIAMNNINAEIVIAIINHYGDNILSYINEIQNLMEKEIQYLHKFKTYDDKKKENIHLILDRIIEIKNFDINYIHNDYSFLFYACEMNDIRLCEKLLKCDSIDVNISISPNGITPIISALDLYNYDIVEMLINHPNINLHVKNNNDIDAITIILRRQNAKLIKLLADKDNPDALYKFGYMLENGLEIPVNKKEAVNYYKKASHKMNTEAMISLGKMLENGDGIAMNLTRACKYYKMAADNDDAIGMNCFGLMLESGKGIPVNLEEACKYFKMSADKGNSYGMNNYGYMLDNGKGIPVNFEEACKYFKMSADAGNLCGMINYGHMLENGKGTSINLEEACKYYKITADRGYTKGMNDYAHMLEEGKGIEMNLEKACEYYKMSADKGNLDGMNDYGIMLKLGKGTPVNFEEACKYFKKAADEGHSSAMFNYGSMLQNGKGVPVNLEEACKYYKMSADNGNTKGMNKYGSMLENGKGIQVNFEEACKYYKMSADKGNSGGMNNYGCMLQSGKGIQVNFEEACKYIKMSADKGDSYGMNNYGIMLENGKGIQINLEEACKYYKMSADKGNVNGMVNYGYMLKDGKGIPANLEEAKKYYKMAADKGDTNGTICYCYLLMQNNDDDDEMCKYFKKLADIGDPIGINYYAYMLKEGKGVTQNTEEAVKLFKIAADLGNSDGMTNYGYMLDNEIGIEINYEEAVKYYKMAADEGNPVGMQNYGYMLESGKGIAINYEEAVKYYKMAADKGNLNGIFNYGHMLDQGKGIAKNAEEACKYYKISADNGQEKGMVNYGYMLFVGKGVQKDINEALRYYKLAIDKGSLAGMNNYGWCLFRNSSKYEDYEIACKYFKMAIEKNDYYSMVNYGFMLDHGFGVQIDHDEANKYYKKVIDNGETEIIFKLAQIFDDGGEEKGPIDKNEACRYYKLAADANHTESIFRYASMLENGIGIESNREEAIRYFKIAAEKGHKDAIKSLERLV